MASHGGQFTFAQKKMLNMQAQAGNSSLAVSQYSAGPHMAAVRQQSVPFHSDVEMRDVSASTSTDGSPVTNPSQPRVQSTFSAAAKPFTPPSAAIPIISPVASAVTTVAPPVTPAKRAPPHRALKDQAPVAPPHRALKNQTPVVPVAAAKSEMPAIPSAHEHSAAPSPKRRAGPHSKLGPHAQRGPVSLSSTSAESASPVQISLPFKAATQDAWVDVAQPKSESEAWVDVQDTQLEMDVEQSSADQTEMDDKQSSVQAAQITMVQDWGIPAVVHSTPVASTQDWGTPATAELSQSTIQAMLPSQTSTPEAVIESLTPEAAPHSPQEQVELQAESPKFALSEKMSTDDPTTRRYGRNEYLAMLLDMNDTTKGRELIRAFADHIHAGVDPSMGGVATPDAQQEIWMEVSGGQRLAATVPQHTTLINAIKEFATMTRADQSEVRIIFKVGDKDSA